MDKGNIRASLIEDLRQQEFFWSHHLPDQDKLTDDWLIENVMLHSDLDAIYRLFDIFPEEKVKHIWENRLVPDIRNHSLNRLYALILFKISDPDKYLQEKIKEEYGR